jgi:hypothetical protein
MTLNPIFHIEMVESEMKDLKPSAAQCQRLADDPSSCPETNPTKDQSNAYGFQICTPYNVQRSKGEDTLADHQLRSLADHPQKQYWRPSHCLEKA